MNFDIGKNAELAEGHGAGALPVFGLQALSFLHQPL